MFHRRHFISTLALVVLCSCSCSFDDDIPRNSTPTSADVPGEDPDKPSSVGDVSGQFVTTGIWSEARHNAFTSLVRFKGKFYCAFREADSHIFNSDGKAEGKVRVLVSDDAAEWKSCAFIGDSGIDLRDPKLSVTSDGRLMIIVGASYYSMPNDESSLASRTSKVIFSSDGVSFSSPEAVVFKDDSAITGIDWLWRVTWHGKTGYGVCYSVKKDGSAFISLWKTADGKNYELVKKLDEVTGWPNESTVRFLSDGTMVMVVRRSGNAMWGISKEPYTSWSFNDLGFFVGGPDVLVLDDDRIIIGGRSTDNGWRMSLWMGTGRGSFGKVATLPSSGDCAYPGLLLDGDDVWCSYYSTNGSGTSIYMSHCPVSAFGAKTE